jgi:hypothetical protein
MECVRAEFNEISYECYATGHNSNLLIYDLIYKVKQLIQILKIARWDG